MPRPAPPPGARALPGYDWTKVVLDTGLTAQFDQIGPLLIGLLARRVSHCRSGHPRPPQHVAVTRQNSRCSRLSISARNPFSDDLRSAISLSVISHGCRAHHRLRTAQREGVGCYRAASAAPPGERSTAYTSQCPHPPHATLPALRCRHRLPIQTVLDEGRMSLAGMRRHCAPSGTAGDFGRLR